MRKQIALPVLIIGLLIGSFGSAQVKIGDNPQTIDPTSVLELESTERVLVITRVDSIQMSNITPNRGALVYNTSADCVFYYNGTDWINLCGSDAAVAGFTTDPIVNENATIIITPTPTGGNIEVAENSIDSSQIIDGGINGIDIQNGSIGRGKLQNSSVDRTKLAQNSVGPFAIDNDSIDLSDFNNTTGFIRSGDIISVDPGNALISGGDGGAFYDDAAVAANTAAIAAAAVADNDLNPTNEIQTITYNTGTRIVSLSGNGGSFTLPVGADEVDGSVTNELTDLVFNETTNILSLTNGATVPGSEVDLSSLAGGGGGDDNQTAAEVPVTTVPVNYIAATQDVEAHLAGIDAALLGGGGGGTTEVVDGTTLTGIGTIAEPFTIAPGTDGQFLSTNVDGDVVWAGLPPSGASALFDTTTISGTGVTSDEYTVADDAITLEKINQNAANDGDVLRWDDATTAWIVEAPPGEHNGSPMSLFYADATTGVPTTAFNSNNGDQNTAPSLIWDQTKRINSGALGIGIDGGVMSEEVKVHIAEQLNGQLAYPLELQNRTNQNGNSSSTGVLFSVDLENAHGKGALAYERTGAWGVGDFHFLQNIVTTATNPTLADKSFTITSNKDIQLYGDLIAKTGAATAVGQVLTNTATGTEWADPSGGGGGTDDQNSSEVPYDNATSGLAATDAQAAIDELVDVGNAANGVIQTTISGLQSSIDNLSSTQISYDNATSGLTATDAQAAIDELAAVSGGENLGNTNLVQTDLLRTFEVPENTNLVFTGLGNVGIGNGANPPQQKFHVDGEIRATGYNSSGGTENEPAYAFSTGDDSNTGMYRPAADQIGFSVGGNEALRIEEPSIGINKVVVSQSLELDGPIIDFNNTTGIPGNFLRVNAAGTGIEWSASSGSGGVNTVADKISGDGDETPLSIAADAIGPSELIVDAIASSIYIATGAVTSDDIADGTIESDDYATESVVTSAIGLGAVTGDKIQDFTIGDRHIIGPINGAKILPNFAGNDIFTTANINGGSIFAANDIFAAGLLNVTGNVEAGSVSVAGTPVHPDFVFQKYYLGSSRLKADYNFQTLGEIETFIKKHHHLPGIKSAEQVKKDGSWNLSESNLQNLEKIEELYLHTIEQEKKINQLQSEKETLSDEIKAMRKDLDEIKRMLKKSE